MGADCMDECLTAKRRNQSSQGSKAGMLPWMRMATFREVSHGRFRNRWRGLVILFISLSALFCSYSLVCTSVAYLGRTSGGSSEELRNLDNISVALLKLGLPLSSYALYLQHDKNFPAAPSERAAIDLTSLPCCANDSASLLQDNGTGLFPVQTDSSLPRLETDATLLRHESAEHGSISAILKRLAEVRNREIEKNQGGLSSSSEAGFTTELSTYNVANSFESVQPLWVFYTLCYNGSHFIKLQNVRCREGTDAAAQGPLLPIMCKSQDYYYSSHLAVLKADIDIADRDSSWLLNRKSIAWKNETAAVISIDSSIADASHFFAKVNMWLLMNNATTPAFLDRIHHFMFLTNNQLSNISLGKLPTEMINQFTYLSEVLSLALSPQDEKLHDIDSLEHSLESKLIMNTPFLAASEDRPLCLKKAVITGAMKGSFWPGGKMVADKVRLHLAQKIPTRKANYKFGSNLSLLYVSGRRTKKLVSSSIESGIMKLIHDMGFSPIVVDLEGMSFQKLFALLQGAMAMIAFSCEDLIYPSLFLPPFSILIEIMLPCNVLRRRFETQALDSGLIYLALKCDHIFTATYDLKSQDGSSLACLDNSLCKQHFVFSNANFTLNDKLRVQELLFISRKLVNALGPLSFDVNDKTRQVEIYPQVQNILDGHACKPYFSTKNDTCRSSWVSFMSAGEGPTICHLGPNRIIKPLHLESI